MSQDQPERSDETFQEGVTPVQAFSSPAIPPDSEAGARPRRGRPSRAAVPFDASTAPAGTAPTPA